MNEIRIETDYDAYYPGTEARVVVNWDLDPESPADAIEVRLVWNTAGKGDRDLSIVRSVRFRPETPRGDREVMLKLPWGPYSFSGKLISLIWAVEVVLFPDETSARKVIIIGPNSEEVLIGAAKEAGGRPAGFV